MVVCGSRLSFKQTRCNLGSSPGACGGRDHGARNCVVVVIIVGVVNVIMIMVTVFVFMMDYCMC